MKIIQGGSVTSPQGFRAAGVRCGLKEKGLDLALIYSETPAVCAGVFTTNTFRSPAVIVSSERANSGRAQAIVANSGNANACTGRGGLADAEKMADIAADALSLRPPDVLVASTGIIGRRLDMGKVASGIAEAVDKLDDSGGAAAAEAVMTTDTRPKSVAVSLEIGGRAVTIGGMAKGAGMICPNMATMLSFITTDVAIDKDLLRLALSRAVEVSFNCLTIDGDMSTNDTVLALANGAAMNPFINKPGGDLEAFQQGLDAVALALAKEIAKDGEGATKFVEVRVNNAASRADAHKVAKAIANSPLVKTAIFGQDPNWGRVLAAAGKSGATFNAAQVALYFGGVKIVENGEPTGVPEEEARCPMLEKELILTLDLGAGDQSATVFTCDMTYDYIRINAVPYVSYTTEQADVLIQALPYIQKYCGKTFVIKYGGNAMVDEGLKQMVMQDVVLMRFVGMKPILVHGGGPEISEVMKKVGKQPEFVGGLRVTDAETMEIVEMVLAGKTNKGIVSIINNLGGRAVGLSGKDANLIRAEKAVSEVDLGYVGHVTKIDPSILETLSTEGYIPVISSVAIGPQGESLNVNADHIAGSLAAAVKAEKLIMLTDVKGIYDDLKRPETLKSVLDVSDAQAMVEQGKIERGMIPKVEACVTALAGGVARTHIIDGTLPHALLIEVFTDTGIGTMIEQ